MRQFNLLRSEDPSGMSGVGYVTEGVVFTDGTVAMRWLTLRSSTCLYASMADVEAIHGHNGMTIIEWADEDTHANVD